MLNGKRQWMYGFLLMLLVDVLLITSQVKEYQTQIQILCIMAGEESNLATATEILKGKVDLAEIASHGKEVLTSYGYLTGQTNRLSKALVRKVVATGTVSLMIYGITLIMLRSSKQSIRRSFESELELLSERLDQLSKNLYESEKLNIVKRQEPSFLKIDEQIQSIADTMRLNHKRLSIEKEETKSLVTDLSHQLKTPVAALKTCFEVLNQKDLKAEERREFEERCSRQLTGLEDLLEALLSISKLEAGMIQMRMEPALILDTIAAAVSRVYPSADRKQITMEMEAKEELQTLVILQDKHWLCEAIMNLLENAVKYSPLGSVIRIRMVKRVTFLRIEVEDEGIGIPKGEYHKVFQRFYRGQSKEVRSETGSGVGLYLAREIIQMHNGNISVTSKQEALHGNRKGSTFLIQLPYK